MVSPFHVPYFASEKMEMMSIFCGNPYRLDYFLLNPSTRCFQLHLEKVGNRAQFVELKTIVTGGDADEFRSLRMFRLNNTAQLTTRFVVESF